MNNLLEFWDTSAVTAWLNLVGFQVYEQNFRDNDITGEVLLNADLDMLKELDVTSVGHRLALLRDIQELKQSQGYEASPDQQSSRWQLAQSQSASASNDRLNVFGAVSATVDASQYEDYVKENDAKVSQINIDVKQLKLQVSQIIEYLEQMESKSAQQPYGYQSLQRAKTVSTSPNKKGNISPKAPIHTFKPVTSLSNAPAKSAQPVKPKSTEVGHIKIFSQKLQNHEFEGYKSVQVLITDTCSTVLPVVMKKYKINDDWKKYALFMVFKGQEKCLSYDDCPLQLSNQLKTEQDAPSFYLKSIRATESFKTAAKNADHNSILEAVRSSHGDLTQSPKQVESSLSRHASPPNSNLKLSTDNKTAEANNSIASVHQPNNDEFAVAIYEYKAERDDELDVNIGDSFIVRDKTETGWWVVEKQGRTGWVPSGCLMDKNVKDDAEIGHQGPVQGVALYDYNAIGVNELSIRKDDILMVHKTYQHWLLAELGGVEGWVPSCYVSVPNKKLSTDNQVLLPPQNNDKLTSVQSQTPTAFNTKSISATQNLNHMSAASDIGSLPSSTFDDNATHDADISNQQLLPRSNKLNFKDYARDSVISGKTQILRLDGEPVQAPVVTNFTDSIQPNSQRKKSNAFADVMSKLKEYSDDNFDDDDKFDEGNDVSVKAREDAMILTNKQQHKVSALADNSKTFKYQTGTITKLDSLLDQFDDYWDPDQDSAQVTKDHTKVNESMLT